MFDLSNMKRIKDPTIQIEKRISFDGWKGIKWKSKKTIFKTAAFQWKKKMKWCLHNRIKSYLNIIFSSQLDILKKKKRMTGEKDFRSTLFELLLSSMCSKFSSVTINCVLLQYFILPPLTPHTGELLISWILCFAQSQHLGSRTSRLTVS